MAPTRAAHTVNSNQQQQGASNSTSANTRKTGDSAHPYPTHARPARKRTQSSNHAVSDAMNAADGSSDGEDAQFYDENQDPSLSPVSPVASTSKRSKKKSSNQDSNDASGALPKSTRQQYSACHGCRVRRIKCDLKDVNTAYPGENRGCSQCRDRNYACKDDNRKQLRRGKRINALEQEESGTLPIPNAPQPPTSIIPVLHPDFFQSPFFRRFHIQRPIIDPEEFVGRYTAWLQHHSRDSNASLSSASQPLTPEGQVLAKVLVAWAAAYGIDERGVESPDNADADIEERNARVTAMIEEILGMIDSLGLLRKPTWDGVRVLLMTLPLAENAMSDLNRLAMYESTVQQVYTLYQYEGVMLNGSSNHRAATALVRARIFWYAHVHEGITTGLRGGRLLMDDDDLQQFQRQLPHQIKTQQFSLERTGVTYSHAYQYATAPLRLASACRLVHSAVTGPKARAASTIDGKKLDDAWEALATCWEEFEGLRNVPRRGVVGEEETTRFIDGWQIFVFDCYNVINVKIGERLEMLDSGAGHIVECDDDEASKEAKALLRRQLAKYRDIATAKCDDALDNVVKMIRRHVGSSFFAYDASLVRDGCFYAGYMLAHLPGREDDMNMCMRALMEMRWAFSKRVERVENVKGIYASVQAMLRRQQEGQYGQFNGGSGSFAGFPTQNQMQQAFAEQQQQAAAAAELANPGIERYLQGLQPTSIIQPPDFGQDFNLIYENSKSLQQIGGPVGSAGVAAPAVVAHATGVPAGGNNNSNSNSATMSSTVASSRPSPQISTPSDRSSPPELPQQVTSIGPGPATYTPNPLSHSHSQAHSHRSSGSPIDLTSIQPSSGGAGAGGKLDPISHLVIPNLPHMGIKGHAIVSPLQQHPLPPPPQVGVHQGRISISPSQIQSGVSPLGPSPQSATNPYMRGQGYGGHPGHGADGMLFSSYTNGHQPPYPLSNHGHPHPHPHPHPHAFQPYTQPGHTGYPAPGGYPHHQPPPRNPHGMHDQGHYVAGYPHIIPGNHESGGDDAIPRQYFERHLGAYGPGFNHTISPQDHFPPPTQPQLPSLQGRQQSGAGYPGGDYFPGR